MDNIADMIAGALAAIGLLALLFLIGWILMAWLMPFTYSDGERHLTNLRKQQRLFVTYREWLKTRPADRLTFDEWKEAHGK